MNIVNRVEDDHSWFLGVVIALSIVMCVLFILVYFFLVRAGMLAI